MTHLKEPTPIVVAGISGNVITLQDAGDARAFRGAPMIALRVSGHLRHGTLRVRSADEANGTITTEERVHDVISTACTGDRIMIVSKDIIGLSDSIPPDDHATLVAYLLCMVKRGDWRAVSDCANDLRVLEAQMGKR